LGRYIYTRIKKEESKMIRKYKLRTFMVDILNGYKDIRKLNISKNTIYEYDDHYNLSSKSGMYLKNNGHYIKIDKRCFQEYFEEVR
jgi:hypothetical protein